MSQAMGDAAAGLQVLDLDGQTDTGRTDNLPVDLSTFVGREPALSEAQGLLAAARLLTFTGTGGVGKTRLALRLAATVRGEYPDGVWLIELSPVADSALVAGSVGRVLGLSDGPSSTIATTLVKFLRAKRMLLVLDNCEHLVQACADLATLLLSKSPGLRILATSREPLGVDGEVTWPIPAMTLPDPDVPLTVDVAARAEAVQLFVERARAVRSVFHLTPANAPAVVELCRQLDGIPLALELAAALVRGLAPEQLVALMRHRFRVLADGNRTAPPRQRTLRATIDWSYALLRPDEQNLLARLAVFAGGWTLDAAQAICRDTQTSVEDVLLHLLRLVSTSLVVAEPTAHGEVRYRLLESVREYGLEHLTADRRDAGIRRRHAEFFLTLAEELGPEGRVWGVAAPASLARLEREHDNLRAALRWALEAGEAPVLISLVLAMSNFWEARGHFTEARSWFQIALDSPEGRGRTHIRALLLYGLARCVHRQGDYDAGRAIQEEALAIAREMNDLSLAANALVGLGFNASGRADYPRARAAYEEALSLYRALGNPLRQAVPLSSLGLIAARQGEYALAQDWASEALVLAREANSAHLMGLALRALGLSAELQGDLISAERLFREAVALNRNAANQWSLGDCLVSLGSVLAARGQRQEGLLLMEEGLQIHRRTGEGLGLIRGLEEVACRAAASAPEYALQLAARAETMRERLGTPLWPEEARRLHFAFEVAQRMLGGGLAARAQAQGRTLSTDEALALVLAFRQKTPDPSEPRSEVERLSPRECEVLRLLANGRTNSEIADALVLSRRTVERHISNLYGKIDARGRADATAYALRHGLV